LEYFGWGRYGGIGKATRDIAQGLSARGVEVHALVPRGINQPIREMVDGVHVHSFPVDMYPWIGEIIRLIGADVYHSQDPSIGTVVAMKKMPDSIHVMTCQNPKTKEDWRRVNRFYSPRRKIYNALVEPMVLRKLNRLDMVFCQCNFIIEKAVKLYKLEHPPEFLPNPVKMLESNRKSESPKTCFLGRLDGEKNPERFFELSREHPRVSFIAAGRSHNEARDRQLRKAQIGVNLTLTGHIDGPEKRELLESSWVLVNTSISECLPVSFLEAASAGCAILSPHDPDGFASGFGYHVKDNFSEGLEWLLDGSKWRGLGRKGQMYVKKNHEYEMVIDRHIKVYEELLG
jgi:glycosyltransferase involved in cell wall biosynthesis